MGLFKPPWMSNTANYEKAIAESIYNTQTDQTKLGEIAKNAANELIRGATIEKLTDITILIDLAQNDVRTYS